MTLFKDLETCTYFPFESQNLIAIGWLSPSWEFPRGDVSRAFYDKLCQLSRDPWEPSVSVGLHQCELCQFDGPPSTSNVFIPFKGRIYVAPALITHYISAHWYKPPDVFISAVLSCPEIRSMDYKRALLENGGRALVKAPSP